MAGDFYWTDVVLSCHLNGTNGSTTITDSSSYAHALTAFNQCQLTTTNPKWGTACCTFDGSSDGFYTGVSPHATAHLYPADFTIEFWAKWTTIPITWGGFISPFESGAGVKSAQNYAITAVAGGEIQVYQGSSGTLLMTSSGGGGGTGYNDGNWHHIAVTREGSTVRLYVDGVHRNSASNSAQWGNATGLIVGEWRGNEPNAWLNGQMDDVRITKGVARYTGSASFTPPTEQFPDGPLTGGPFPYYIRSSLYGGLYLPRGF